MAIHKTAQNLKLALKNSYKVQTGRKLLKVHGALRVVAVDGNLALHCGKKIMAHGNEQTTS